LRFFRSGATRLRLIELEEMSYRKGFQAGPDLAFAGVRIVVAEADEHCQMATVLEIRQWLAAPEGASRTRRSLGSCGSRASNGVVALNSILDASKYAPGHMQKTPGGASEVSPGDSALTLGALVMHLIAG
jgi:hypothetical protein